MACNVLVIPDKFKGTLTAAQAAESIRLGWLAARPQDNLRTLPMCDGGDGFGDILGQSLGASRHTARVCDAAHRPCEAHWWYAPHNRTAVIESAAVIGLARLPEKKYHPFELDTEGLGQLLRAASEHGARTCLVGIGGSATNDGGFGMARALGWQFGNQKGDRIERWTELHALREISSPKSSPLFETLTVAVDVQNPLLGPEGCSRVFGPQKGLRPEDFDFAERCLGRLAQCLREEKLGDFSRTPGAGAAGGLGFGLLTFCGAKLQPGFELYAKTVGLDEQLKEVDLVITAEGGLDEQTIMGKGVGELAQWCQARDVPCLGLAGVVTVPEKAEDLFARTYAMTPDFASREEAMGQAGAVLQRLAAKAAEEWAH